jgi:hypothetical protein
LASFLQVSLPECGLPSPDGQQLDAVLIKAGWGATYNLIIISQHQSLKLFERQQLRRHARVALQLPAMVERPNGNMIRMSTQ